VWRSISTWCVNLPVTFFESFAWQTASFVTFALLTRPLGRWFMRARDFILNKLTGTRCCRANSTFCHIADDAYEERQSDTDRISVLCNLWITSVYQHLATAFICFVATSIIQWMKFTSHLKTAPHPAFPIDWSVQRYDLNHLFFSNVLVSWLYYSHRCQSKVKIEWRVVTIQQSLSGVNVLTANTAVLNSVEILFKKILMKDGGASSSFNLASYICELKSLWWAAIWKLIYFN